MTDPAKSAITAIGDSALESSTVSALIRLGWNVLYRALSFSDLENYLEKSENISGGFRARGGEYDTDASQYVSNIGF